MTPYWKFYIYTRSYLIITSKKYYLLQNYVSIRNILTEFTTFNIIKGGNQETIRRVQYVGTKNTDENLNYKIFKDKDQ